MSMPWYGELPERWKAIRIKNLFALIDERNFKPLSDVQLLSLYTAFGVKPNKEIEKTTGNRAVTADNYKIVHVDDIIVNIILCWQGAIGVSKYDGVTSPAYDVYRAKSEAVNVDYFNYLYRLPLFSGECYKAGRGIMAMRWRTYSDHFTAITVPMPPRNEQDQIVRYLNWKVSRINKLINAKRRQIELLQEQKHITIKNTVRYTDGCKKCKLKNLAFFKSGTNLTALQIEPVGDYPVYGGNGIRGYYPEFSHFGEYLLIGRQGALCGNVHYINEHFWATEHAITVKPNDIIHIKWLYYLLIDMNLNQYSIAAAQPGLSVEYIVNLSTYFPTLEKQKTIAIYLDEQCGRIDKIVRKLNNEIALFTEYRTRLISDVVTGKLDVRGVVVPEYEAEDESIVNNDDMDEYNDDI